MISNTFSEFFFGFGNSTFPYLPPLHFLPLTKELQSQIAFVLCSATIAFIVAFTVDLFFSNLFNINGRKTKSVSSPVKIKTTPSAKKVFAHHNYKKSSPNKPNKSPRKVRNRGMKYDLK